MAKKTQKSKLPPQVIAELKKLKVFMDALKRNERR